MILQLKRPLVFLDFETTGLDVKNDRILELAFIRLLETLQMTRKDLRLVTFAFKKLLTRRVLGFFRVIP